MHMTVNERPLSGIIERLMYDRYYGVIGQNQINRLSSLCEQSSRFLP